MSAIHNRMILLGVFGVMLAGRPVVANETPEPGIRAYEFLPAETLVAAVVRDGDRRVTDFRKLLDRMDFAKTKVGRRILTEPELMQGRIFLAGIAAMAETDLWSATGALLGRDLALGIKPRKGKQPEIIVVSVLREPAVVDRLLDQIHMMTGLVIGDGPDPERSKQIGEVRVFSANKNTHHCRVGEALIVSNSRPMIQAALKARKNKKKSLSSSPRFEAARKTVPDLAMAWSVVDVKKLRQSVSGKEMRPKLGNPLVAFLFGEWWHAIRHAEEAVAWVAPDRNGLAVEARLTAAKAAPRSHRGFSPETVLSQKWLPSDLPRFLADIRVSREWADLFAEREVLLTLPAAGDVVNFSTTVSTLFGGMDFMDQVLPKLASPARLIVANQDFSSSDLLPSPKLPAFALVVPLKSPESTGLGRRLQSATQMAMSIISLDQAQKGFPAYLVDIDKHRGHRIVFSEFDGSQAPSGMGMSPPSDSDDSAEKENETGPVKTDIRYNFAPAAAVVEGQYIVATSVDLVRDLIDVIVDGKARDSRLKDDALTINMQSLVRILESNREELIVNRMLEEDQSKREARRDIDAFIALLEMGDRFSLSSGSSGNVQRASVRIQLREPARQVPKR